MFKNQITVRCNDCRTNTTVNPNDFDVSNSSSEEQMGMETIYTWEEEVPCDNPTCDNVMTIRDTVSEYPVGSLNSTETEITGGVYVLRPDYDFHGKPDEE